MVGCSSSGGVLKSCLSFLLPLFPAVNGVLDIGNHAGWATLPRCHGYHTISCHHDIVFTCSLIAVMDKLRGIDTGVGFQLFIAWDLNSDLNFMLLYVINMCDQTNTIVYLFGACQEKRLSLQTCKFSCIRREALTVLSANYPQFMTKKTIVSTYSSKN